MSVYSIIKELEANSGSNAKLAILKQNASNKTLRDCFLMALEPRLNFYIKKIPNVTSHANAMSLEAALSELEKFYTRTLSGHAARDHVAFILSQLSEEDAFVFKRVLGRDLKCGTSIKTVNKVWDKLLATYAYMRCCLPAGSNISKFDWSKGVFVQTKMDGMFSNNICSGNSVSILSRAGSPYPAAFSPDLQNELRKLKEHLLEDQSDLVIHGELLIFDKATEKYLARKTGNGMLNSCLQDGEFDSDKYVVHVVVWDFVPLANWENKKDWAVKYSIRFERLLKAIEAIGAKNILPVKSKTVYSKAEAMEVYRQLRKDGEEGAVLKSPDMIWEDGTSKDQIKMKVAFEIDLEIVGFNPGNGKNEKFFGSIKCKTCDGLLLASASGISDDERAAMDEIKDSLIGTIVTLVANDLITSESKDTMSLFQPRFVERRLDKTVANSLQEVKDIYAAAQSAIFGDI